jgi:hypothetical protein
MEFAVLVLEIIHEILSMCVVRSLYILCFIDALAALQALLRQQVMTAGRNKPATGLRP